jgi:DNA-binding NarL/FixJ family response regulator
LDQSSGSFLAGLFRLIDIQSYWSRLSSFKECSPPSETLYDRNNNMKNQLEEAMETLSILVADDHEMVRRGLCSLLEVQPEWKTLEASDGHEAVLKATRLHPDIVIMDISMPQLNGLEAARQLLQEIPQMPVVLLSAYSTEEMIDKALATGVRGYVLKTDAAKDLVAAVEAVFQGRTFFTSIVSRRLLDCVSGSRTTDEHSTLTQREIEVIQLLGEGKSNKETAHLLGISTRTVENHRAHIMQKLDLRSFGELIRYAIRSGIVQP